MSLPPARSVRSAVLAVVLVSFAALLLAACGSGSGSGTGGSGGSGTRVAWLFFGPKNDGGYNVSQWRPAQADIRRAFGDRVQQVETDNLSYTEELSQITQQYISTGAKLIFDTTSAGDLFTDVCGRYVQQVHCVEVNPVGDYPDAAKQLPENVSAVYPEFWNVAYLLGIAAGRLTRTNTIGFIGAYNIPVQNASANAYLLGCQSVNPQCKLNRVSVNNFYDPAKTAQITRSLINTGADVIHGWTDDPSYCQVAQEEHVRALGNFTDYRDLCPDAYAGGMLWHYPDYYVGEVKKQLDGTWTGNRTHWARLGEGANLAPWGKDVPQSVQDEVRGVYDRIRSGTDVFRGPIYDNKGTLRVRAGEELDGRFLYNHWTWLVRGTS